MPPFLPLCQSGVLERGMLRLFNGSGSGVLLGQPILQVWLDGLANGVSLVKEHCIIGG